MRRQNVERRTFNVRRSTFKERREDVPWHTLDEASARGEEEDERQDRQGR
jgi:hypothetical protein